MPRVDEHTEFDVDKLIRCAWEDVSRDISGKDNGMSMPSIIEHADADNCDRVPLTVQNWLSLYDEFGAWFVNLAMLLTTSTLEDRVKLSSQQISLTCLLGNISAQIIAIRSLIISGLDVQAKQLLRVLTEQIDVALIISDDVSISEEFMLTLDGDSSNRFWHKHVKGGKIRKSLFLALETEFGNTQTTSLMGFIKQEEKVLGMGIHPSLAASQMACLPETGRLDEPFSFGFLGKATIFSERTISYAIFYMTFYIAAGFVPEERELDYSRPASNLIGPFQERVLRGRKVLLRIMSELIPNWHHPLLTSDLEFILDSASQESTNGEPE